MASERVPTWNTAGSPVAGNLEHIREHQHQPLRVGERSGKRSGSKGAVRGSGRSKLTLHLLYFQRLPCIIEAVPAYPHCCAVCPIEAIGVMGYIVATSLMA